MKFDGNASADADASALVFYPTQPHPPTPCTSLARAIHRAARCAGRSLPPFPPSRSPLSSPFPRSRRRVPRSRLPRNRMIKMRGGTGGGGRLRFRRRYISAAFRRRFLRLLPRAPRLLRAPACPLKVISAPRRVAENARLTPRPSLHAPFPPPLCAPVLRLARSPTATPLHACACCPLRHLRGGAGLWNLFRAPQMRRRGRYSGFSD